MHEPAASKVRKALPQTLARLPALQGRYLSKRPYLLSQLRNPLLFVGKPTGEQLDTVGNLKAEVKRTILEKKRLPRAARRPPLEPSLHRSRSAMTLSDCYFGERPLLLHTVESVVFERKTDRRPVVVPPELEELAEFEGAVRDLLVSKMAKLAGNTIEPLPTPLPPPPRPDAIQAVFADPLLAQVHNDFQNVTKLFNDALDIAREESPPLARVLERVRQSYDATFERLAEEQQQAKCEALQQQRREAAMQLAPLREQNQQLREQLQEAQATIAEQNGVLQFHQHKQERMDAEVDSLMKMIEAFNDRNH